MRDVADPQFHVVAEIQNSFDTIGIRQSLSFHRFQEEPHPRSPAAFIANGSQPLIVFFTMFFQKFAQVKHGTGECSLLKKEEQNQESSDSPVSIFEGVQNLKRSAIV